MSELRPSVYASVVDIVKLVREFAGRRLANAPVAIFGNEAVMKSNVYGALPAERVVAMSERAREEIHETYNTIALKGRRGTDEEYAVLERRAAELLQRGAVAIILAGTDLSSFYRDRAPRFPFIDVAQIHIEAIARAAGLVET